MTAELTGRVAAITGGGGVLCSTLAQALVEQGADVAVLDVNPQAATRVAEQLRRAGGGRSLAVTVDVLDKASLLEAASQIHDQLGPVDILINGAGGNKPEATAGPHQSFFEIPAEALRWVFELNCLGTILPCQVFVPDMVARRQGVVINMASMTAVRPLTRVVAYGAAKAAVVNFTQWLAVHLAQEYSPAIRVNAIAPGFFLTAQNEFLLLDRETRQPTERGRTILDHTPAQRYGEPEDLVGTVLWLVSDAARFVSGAVIPIDGGFSACSGV